MWRKHQLRTHVWGSAMRCGTQTEASKHLLPIHRRCDCPACSRARLGKDMCSAYAFTRNRALMSVFTQRISVKKWNCRGRNEVRLWVLNVSRMANTLHLFCCAKLKPNHEDSKMFDRVLEMRSRAFRAMKQSEVFAVTSVRFINV